MPFICQKLFLFPKFEVNFHVLTSVHFSIKKIGTNTLESYSLFIMVYSLRKVKDVHLLFAPKTEEERKIFNYQEGLRRKTSFVFKIFALQKKFSS